MALASTGKSLNFRKETGKQRRSAPIVALPTMPAKKVAGSLLLVGSPARPVKGSADRRPRRKGGRRKSSVPVEIFHSGMA